MTLFCCVSTEVQRRISELRQEKDCIRAPVLFSFKDGYPDHVEVLGENLGSFKATGERLEGTHVYEFRAHDGESAFRDIGMYKKIELVIRDECRPGHTSGGQCNVFRFETDGKGSEHRLFVNEYSH